jgi:hypothetical protein
MVVDMSNNQLQLIFFFLLGMFLWLSSYSLQRSKHLHTLPIKPPKWIVWLCGNPTQNDILDLNDVGTQGLGLILLIGEPTLYVLGVEPRTRLAVIGLVCILFGIAYGILFLVLDRRKK